MVRTTVSLVIRDIKKFTAAEVMFLAVCNLPPQKHHA